MTRVTNFGRKRKYLEAGFATESTTTPYEQPVHAADNDQEDAAPSKENRKRTKKPKLDGGDEPAPDGIERGGEVEGQGKGEGPSAGQRKASMRQKPKIGGAKSVAISGYKKRTEQRRLKRTSDRQANTTCFACREKGHAAKDCPKAGREGGRENSANAGVGSCYRCGSTKHTLSRCKKPEDPLNRFPFASCFVCSGKGHLASACPQNKEKGIYPNGGSCKLCGEKTHLAKDCELRKKDASGSAATAIFGTGGGAGADEDDFHTFKRNNAEVARDEKKEDRRRQQLDVKAGMHTGTVKAFGKSPMPSRPKKVVYF